MKTNETSTQVGLQRVSNASEYVTNGQPYQVFPNKIKVCQISLPQGIEFAKREKTLYSIGLQYLSLNQDMSEDMLYSYISSINKAPHINTPLSSQSLSRIVKMIFNKKDKEGELEVVPNKERTVIFDDIKFNITNKEKMNIVNKEKGLLKQERTKQTINDAIVDWTGSTKITTAGIAASTGLSLRTVKTYWPTFKEYVTDLNKAFKSIKKVKVISEVQVEEIIPEIEDNNLDIDKEKLILFQNKYDKSRSGFDYYSLLQIDDRFNVLDRFKVRPLIENYRGYKYTLKQLIIECNKLIN